MDAGLGNNPSYVWRSLLAAREFIKEGAVWKVGDGKKIEVSMHRWLSHKPIFIGETRPNMLVRELMNTVTIEPKWRILSIPLQITTGRDNLVWQENSSNNFIVKLAHQVALRLQDKSQSEHLRAGLDRPIWRKIWKLNAPPKVRNFLWRACSNILPTRENLHRCKM